MMDCRDVQQRFWSGEDPAGLEGHLASCEGCRLELRRSELLASALSSLASELAPVPAGLESALLATIPRPLGARLRRLAVHPTFWRGAAVGAAAAAVAAAFGLIVARRLVRPDLVA